VGRRCANLYREVQCQSPFKKVTDTICVHFGPFITTKDTKSTKFLPESFHYAFFFVSLVLFVVDFFIK
jgi:hypothetical protein